MTEALSLQKIQHKDSPNKRTFGWSPRTKVIFWAIFTFLSACYIHSTIRFWNTPIWNGKAASAGGYFLPHPPQSYILASFLGMGIVCVTALAFYFLSQKPRIDKPIQPITPPLTRRDKGVFWLVFFIVLAIITIDTILIANSKATFVAVFWALAMGLILLTCFGIFMRDCNKRARPVRRKR